MGLGTSSELRSSINVHKLCAPLEAFMLGLQLCRMLKGVTSLALNQLCLRNSIWWMIYFFFKFPLTSQQFSDLHFLPCSFWNFVGQMSAFCQFWGVCAFSWLQLISLPSEVCRPSCLHQMPGFFPIFLYFLLFLYLP